MTPTPEPVAEAGGVTLLPCPFCGSREPKIFSNGIGDYYVRCDSEDDSIYACGASTSDRNCETEEGAARRWNCRPSAQPPQPTGDVGELVKRLEARAGGVDQFYGSTDEELDREAIAALNSLNSRTPRSALKADDVEWVVNDIAELGVKIGSQFFWLYKGGSLVYGEDEKSRTAGVCLNEDTDPPTRHKWRHVFKREFGECCHPVNYADPKLIGTVSLDDSDEWQDLPPALSPTEPATP